eukprot:scaffold63615_cov53-Phaeocystis_antarctica.AAC.3
MNGNSTGTRRGRSCAPTGGRGRLSSGSWPRRAVPSACGCRCASWSCAAPSALPPQPPPPPLHSCGGGAPQRCDGARPGSTAVP